MGTTRRVRRALPAVFDGYDGRLLALVAATSLLSVGGRALLPPLLSVIIEDLGITAARAGLALTVMTALSAVCRYPGGRLADDLSRKTVVVAAVASMAVGFAILTGARTYATFVAGTVAVGVGGGLYLPSAFALLSDLFVDRRGQAIGINNAAVSLGGILAAGLAVAVAATTSWRVAFVPVVALLLVVGALMHRWNEEPYVVGPVGLDVRATARRLFANGQVRLMVVSAALVMFVQRGAVAFIPLFLETDKAFGQTLAGAAFGGFYLVGMVATPVTGWVGDRIGHAPVTFGAALVGAAGLVLAVLGTGTLPVTIGVLVFALGMTGFWPGMNAYVLALFPDDSTGGDFGALGTVYLGIGSLGPTYVGVVAEQVSYLAAFASLVPPLLASAVVGAWLSR